MSIRELQLLKVQNEGMELFKLKNKDYGDAFAKYGPIGVLMRMGDKLSRLQSISKNGIALVDDEKVRDTLIDLHNYSAMAIMLLDEGTEITKQGEIIPSDCEDKDDQDVVENSEDKLTFDPTIIGEVTFEKLYSVTTDICKVMSIGILMVFFGNAFQMTAHNIFYKTVK